jgi:hypothetical protein
VLTPIFAGLPALTPVVLGAPEGTVRGDFALGSISIAIVAACWLYAWGSRGEGSFAHRHSLRLLRAARAVREVIKDALESAKEKL